MTKDRLACWNRRAEAIDSLRVFPRIIILTYLGVALWVTIYFSVMYFHLPPEQRTLQLTAYMGGVTGVIWGAFPWIIRAYMDNGRNWDADKMQPTVIAANANASSQ